MIVYGINPVLEAIRAGRVKALRISSRDDERMRELLAFASAHGIAPERVTNDVLARQAKGGVHQGVVADVDEASEYTVHDLVRSARGEPLILVLDGIDAIDLYRTLYQCDPAQPPKADAYASHVVGVSRDKDMPRAIVIHFSREPSDADLVNLHDKLR